MTSGNIPAPALTLRALGVIMLLAGATAFHALSRLAALPPRHPATPVEFALATVGFLGASAGAALGILGGHVFDRVAVSDRWATRARTGDPERADPARSPG